ncbi:hypothetical protein NDU88_006902 [Pleurodeles waltl]|uniref:P-type ATPase N-terminal domain-containing protein n=1 Tax=Pleurodeles waltl TaxID=8319 RepID=A0AAV7NVU2_PLEWA|nr:hypothetical protein NDU88_006902 [Pleurodeles waltl]
MEKDGEVNGDLAIQATDEEEKKKKRKKKGKREARGWTVHSNLLYEVGSQSLLLPSAAKAAPDNPNRHLPGNRIKTTKYTVLSFLPKNLFEQFHRMANIYFVFIALLNFVPSVNAFKPEMALAPVLFILAVTALKDLWEDYRRYRSDTEINHTDCLVYSRYPWGLWVTWAVEHFGVTMDPCFKSSKMHSERLVG